jgi:hypothetical protein
MLLANWMRVRHHERVGSTELLERPVSETARRSKRSRRRFALRELSPLFAVVVAAVALLMALGLCLAWAQTPSAIRSAVFRAPGDCLPVELMRPELQADLPSGTTLRDIAAIESGYPDYESLFYIAAVVETDGSTAVAVWAANFTDGSYRSSYASFVPVNGVAESLGISEGGLVPPRSDPAIAEAAACAV